MGTKTPCIPFFIKFTHDCEKRIPKHGDENVNIVAPSRVPTLSEKRIPKHGDENFSDLTRGFLSAFCVKKGSPNMGTKTLA